MGVKFTRVDLNKFWTLTPTALKYILVIPFIILTPINRVRFFNNHHL